MNSKTELSIKRLFRLREQGYLNQTNQELNELAFGHRFAFQVCTLILFIGVITANIYVLSFIATIAALAIILPYHPFDYIYNGLLRRKLNKPKLPTRSIQLKFACGVAASCLISVIFLFHGGMLVGGYALGGILCITAFLVSSTDLCIPSKIYNFLFNVNTKYI